MKYIGKIIGFPAKLYSHNMVYIPLEYLRHYGISVKKDKLAMVKSDNSIFLRPLSPGEELPKGSTASIRVGLLVLPAAWIRNNGLKKGDALSILGVSNGLIIYTT